jgi:NADPH:quinone reductase-like Zn-dependent oxidoreductase
VTAWNALLGFGSGGVGDGDGGPRGVRKGDVVLTQGAGAEGLFAAGFAAGFAVAAGARVIGTVSGEAKGRWLGWWAWTRC